MEHGTSLDLFCIATFRVVDESHQSSAIVVPIREGRNDHKGFTGLADLQDAFAQKSNMTLRYKAS